MLIVKKLPWISLTLVLLSFSTLGWVLSETQAPWFAWVVVVLAVLLLVASLTVPWSLMTKYSITLFRSNTRSFFVAVFGAFLFFLMLAWFRLFLDSLLIISAAILARIDFQAAGFSEGQTFWLTSIFSVAGVALGSLIYMGFAKHLW